MKQVVSHEMRLLGGDIMTVDAEARSITIGPASINFSRPLVEADIQVVLTIYAMGSAARCRFVNMAWETFLKSFTPTTITGYTADETNNPSTTN